MVTPIQHRIFLFIQEYILKHGFSPSLVEIAKGIGISQKSISLVSRCIHALVESGKLTFHKKGYRNIHVVKNEDFFLPVVNRIKPERKMDLSSVFKSKAHFLFEITENSLSKEGIFNGDLIICKHTTKAHEGELVLVLIDEQETLKRVSYKIPERITLIPLDSFSKPKAHLPNRVSIKGVVTGVLRLLSDQLEEGHHYQHYPI